MASLQIVLIERRSKPNSKTGRLVLGLSLVLVFQIILFYVSGLICFGFSKNLHDQQISLPGY
jgi:hypothetical protein